MVKWMFKCQKINFGREIERGDCEIGNAEWQLNMGLYPQGGYTCEVDTSKDSMDECSKQILGYIDV